MRPRVLVVEDDAAMREVLLARIERWGFAVDAAGSVGDARAAVVAKDPDIVICDLVLPDATGIDLLRTLKAGDPTRVVLLMTSYATIDAAVSAIKLGATDFLTKPLDYVALRKKLEATKAVGPESTPSVPMPLRPAAALSDAAGGMVGSSPAMCALQDEIRLAARSDAPVLIVGESGTGKELVARSIHDRSLRGSGAFVPVNAAAVPDALVEGEFFGFERGAFTGASALKAGLFEQADGGTLFLDEVTEMPAAVQTKFLRVLEGGGVRRLGSSVERNLDVRVVAATNRDPNVAVQRGRLRQDVLFRLDVLRIVVPPLRDRICDVEPLTLHFLAELSGRYSKGVKAITAEAMETLRGHDWPGNVRELRNVVERAFVATADATITAGDLRVTGSSPREPARTTAGIVIPHGVTASEAEQIVIVETLKKTGNNKAEAARRLGLDVKTIRKKLREYAASQS